MALSHEVIVAAMREGIPVLVIGGQALPAYGVVRQTVDLDCLIAAGDLGRVDGHLCAAGYSAGERSPIFVRYRHPDHAVEEVDLLLVDPETMAKMLRRSRDVTVGGERLRVPALGDLIALKLHAMRNNPKRFLRDASDIADLLRANPGAVSPGELRRLCDAYGPAGVFEELEGR